FIPVVVRSSGNRFVWLHDSNPVIGELKVHAGDLNLGHVTARAFLLADAARQSGFDSRFCGIGTRPMTFNTPGIVVAGVPIERLVRIVTRNARNSSIRFVVTAAVENPVRLKSYVVYPKLPRHTHHLFKAAMTSPAELLRELIWIELARVQNLRIN